jgi:circadian clock protein KaiB
MGTIAALVGESARPGEGPVLLRLYVAGDAPNSSRARANLRRLLADVDPARYDLEIIDCLDEPLRALNDGVLVTPTLVRVQPEPQRTVVGTLSALDHVADALDIEVIIPPAGDRASHE